MVIVICEDDIIYQKSICDKIEIWKSKNKHADVWVELFGSSEDFLDAWQNGLEADLFFLDIQFSDEIDGVALAKEIRITDKYTPIVFVTNFVEFWYEGYEVNALRYLRKPIRYEEIEVCLGIAYQRKLVETNEFLILRDSGKKIALRFSEIIFLEARYPYLLIYTASNKEVIKIKMKFSDINTRLSSNLFFQCHRSYIVNLLYIRIINHDGLFLSSGDIVPLSKTFYKQINQAFDVYYQGAGKAWL